MDVTAPPRVGGMRFTTLAGTFGGLLEISVVCPICDGTMKLTGRQGERVHRCAECRAVLFSREVLEAKFGSVWADPEGKSVVARDESKKCPACLLATLAVLGVDGFVFVGCLHCGSQVLTERQVSALGPGKSVEDESSSPFVDRDWEGLDGFAEF